MAAWNAPWIMPARKYGELASPIELNAHRGLGQVEPRGLRPHVLGVIGGGHQHDRQLAGLGHRQAGHELAVGEVLPDQQHAPFGAQVGLADRELVPFGGVHRADRALGHAVTQPSLHSQVAPACGWHHSHADQVSPGAWYRTWMDWLSWFIGNRRFMMAAVNSSLLPGPPPSRVMPWLASWCR